MRRAQRNTAFYKILLVLFLATFLLAPSRQRLLPTAGTVLAGTIQTLIENSSNGDSIFLAGGTYEGNIVIDRSLVFGALDSTNPPRIITSGPGAGLTLSADGITINGVAILGNASTGLQILSDDNRISGSTITGHGTGVVFTSASHNVLSGNIIEGNSVGIDLDRSSGSNLFYFNAFNNTLDAVSQSIDNVWFSAGQEYQYQGKNFTGPLGNHWQGAGTADSNGDGVGDASFTLVPGRAGSSGGGRDHRFSPARRAAFGIYDHQIRTLCR